MHLLVLILGFMLFPKGYAMKCYKCTGDAVPCKKEDCPGKCAAATVKYEGGKNMTMKSCMEDKMCATGSMNVGSRRAYAMCCSDAPLCNNMYPSIPENPTPNGKLKCYTCSGNDCSEMKELSCSGDEDRCMSGYAVTGSQGKLMKVMGCTQTSMCMSNINIGVMEVREATCCDGDLCNTGGPSIAVSLLLLVAPVVSVALFN